MCGIIGFCGAGNASASQEQEFLDSVCIGLADDVALNLHIHHYEVSSVEAVCHDSAHEGCREHDGIDKAYTYRQVLKNEVELKGKKIAVIGGGLTGLETAEYLSDFDNEVSVIEMAPAVGTAMYRSVTDAVVGHITKNGGHIMTGTMFKAVGDGFVTLNSLATGYDTDALFDACVIAMGVKPNDAIVAEFEAAFDKVAVVGDTVEPGNIADATFMAPTRPSVTTPPSILLWTASTRYATPHRATNACSSSKLWVAMQASWHLTAHRVIAHRVAAAASDITPHVCVPLRRG